MRFAALMMAIILSMSATTSMAAEQGVIVINPDGSVTDSDNPLARHDAARAAVIKAEKINPPEPEQESAPKPLPEPEPVKKPVPAKAPVKAPVEKAEPAPVSVEAEPKPAKPSALKKVVKTKKKDAVAPATEKSEAAKPPKIKWNKPPKKNPKSVAIEKAPDPAPARSTAPITRDQALRAAIQVAPPFMRSTVMRGNYKGKPVYEVTLQTEDGEDTVLVDAMTGEVIKGH
jgi:uncharacterized membrane protein YkoI